MVKEAKSRALTIRFSESDWAAMHEVSEREDLPVATIVRKAVREYTAQHQPKKKKRKR